MQKPKLHLVLMPNFGPKQPHLGIACLSAYLKQRGIDLTFTDFRTLYNCEQPFSYIGYESNYVPEIPDLPIILAIIRNYNKRKKLIYKIDDVLMDYVHDRKLKYFSLKADIENIYKVMESNIAKFTTCDFIGFTTYETNFLYTIMLSFLIHSSNPKATIIYGGPHVSQNQSAAQLALKSTAADKIIIGEGEGALAEFMLSQNNKKDLIDGVMSYSKKNNIFVFNARKPMDLNSLPCPDFSIFQTKKQPLFSLPLYSSRGCVYSCSFCNEWKQFYPFRQVRYKKLIENMKYLHRKYNAIFFIFADSLLNSSFTWLDNFAEEIIRQNINFQWGGFFRSEMPEDLLKKLKISGLSCGFIGVEAFSDETLARMEKRRSVIDNIKTIELFCSLNIHTTAGVIVGFPGSKESDFKYMWKTLINLKNKYQDLLRINTEPFQLRPMSKIYNNPESYCLSLIKWSDEVGQMVPYLSDIVDKIPMAITGIPKASDTVRRYSLMAATFHNVLQTTFLEGDRKFRKQIVEYLKPSYKIRIPINTLQILPIKLKKKSINNVSFVNWNNARYPLTREEGFILEHFAGSLSLRGVSKKLSGYTKRQEESCYKEIIKLLKNLVKKDFPFEVIF